VSTQYSSGERSQDGVGLPEKNLGYDCDDEDASEELLDVPFLNALSFLKITI
jgi:hypothetical protein